MKKEEWSLQKLLKILFIVFLAFLIFALIFKGITSIVRGTKKVKEKVKQTEKIEKNTSAEPEKVETVKVTYADLENRIKLAAERYENDNYQGTLESKERWVLKYKMLKEKEYIQTKLMDPNESNEECDGYVVFEKVEAKITYTPYIKCGNNYKTKGYDDSL